MTLCDDCIAAERDPHGVGVINAGRPCCMARDVAGTPRRFQREAFAAATSGLSPLEADALRERAHQLIHALRERQQETQS